MSESEVNKSNPSRTLTQYIAAIAATGGGFSFGIVYGWSSLTEPLIVKPTAFYEYDGFDITKDQLQLASSIMFLGAAFGCSIIGTIVQMFGRKSTMLMLGIPLNLGWGLVMFPANLTMLFVGRLVTGFSGGAFCVVAPTYTAEIAEPRIRGRLGNLFQLMLSAGLLFAYIVGALASTIFVMNVICAVFPIIFGIFSLFIPESPTYLISKGKKKEAAKSLKWLRGNEYDYTEELNQLEAQYEAQKQDKVSVFKALGRRSTQKALLIMLGIVLFRDQTGINAVLFRIGSIFEAANSELDKNLPTITVGIVQVLSVAMSMTVVDKLGRRSLLMVSAIATALSTLLLGAYFYRKDNGGDIESLGWLPITTLCIFIVFYSIGFVPITWTLLGELFDNNIKGIASSAAGALIWVLAFLTTRYFTRVREKLGDGPTFWIFSAMTTLGFFFVMIFVPETKGKSLAEVQQILEGEKTLPRTEIATEPKNVNFVSEVDVYEEKQ